MTEPDIRKTLPVLQQQWSTCQACDLGTRRHDVKGAFVFGEGVPGKIMLIGEGPGKDEEEYGRPFVGKSGEVLRAALARLGIQNDVYITNCVACRSCGVQYDSEGQPIMRNGRAFIGDQSPLPIHLDACRARLEEEIYMVDPVLIVALGAVAASALLKRKVSLTVENGTAHTITIPGAAAIPNLTDKKRLWQRRIRKELVAPCDQNRVEYLCVLCFHPAYVLHGMADKRQINPVNDFLKSLTTARDIYHRLQQEVPGITV